MWRLVAFARLVDAERPSTDGPVIAGGIRFEKESCMISSVINICPVAGAYDGIITRFLNLANPEGEFIWRNRILPSAPNMRN